MSAGGDVEGHPDTTMKHNPVPMGEVADKLFLGGDRSYTFTTSALTQQSKVNLQNAKTI